MVNKERVQLLVDALRSDRFDQGSGTLERTYRDGSVKHCCLGVGTRVAMENGVALDTIISGNLESCHIVSTGFAAPGTNPRDPSQWCFGSFPQLVRDWYGFSAFDPKLGYNESEQITAIMANDSTQWTFDQIADAFEREYLTDLPKSKTEE